MISPKIFNFISLTLQTDNYSVELASSPNDNIALYIGVSLIVISVLLLIYFNFQQKLLKVESEITHGYKSIISQVDQLVGDYSKTIEPINFIIHNNMYFVLSKFYDVEGEQTIQIRIDAFRKDGSWNEEFGASGSGYRLIDFDSGRPEPSQILSLPHNELLIIGTLYKEDGPQAFMLVLDSNGKNKTTFNNGQIKTIQINNEKVPRCKNAVLHNGVIYLLCSEVHDLGTAIIAVNTDGNIVPSFGLNGISETLPQTYKTAYPSGISYDVHSNAFYIAAKSGSGLVAKYQSDGKLDNNFGDNGVKNISTVLLHNGFVNQVNNITTLPNGTTLTVGAGNNGFVVAINHRGISDNKIGTNGRIDIRSFYRVESNTIVTDNVGRIFVGGMEYDGNSIMNGLISFFDQNGKPIQLAKRQSIHINSGRPTRLIDLKIDNDGSLLALTKDNNQTISFSTFNIYKIDITNQ
ncbi:hypothetical protein [Halarcobacter ebronensis]|uniref:hypothetical protein n=1 Tax=Halarcobacter ebronensis TaxID=1462615 RepID=UPI00100AE7FF|nr:hypothetical protein [Halarcobacter ebronensis]